MTKIFILDLDGTIIGDCIYQAELYKISLILKDIGINININEILEDSYSEKVKLIRPYFKYFIKTMEELYEDVKFYIYTASEKNWAEKEIKLIEKKLDIKFNRPILTRNDCIKVNEGDYKKSIELIKKRIKIKEGEIIIIDDKDVYIDNQDKLIICNMYNYKYFCDYWDIIPVKRINNNIILNYLKRLIDNGRLNPSINKDTMKEKTEYYKWLLNKCDDINNRNKKYKKDKFWLNITKIIKKNKINSFNTLTIKNMDNILKI